MSKFGIVGSMHGGSGQFQEKCRAIGDRSTSAQCCAQSQYSRSISFVIGSLGRQLQP
jgi:hypothetical protein